MRTNYQSPEELQLLRGFLLTEKKLLLCLTSPYQSRKLISSSSYPTLEFVPSIDDLACIEELEKRRPTQCSLAAVIGEVKERYKLPLSHGTPDRT